MACFPESGKISHFHGPVHSAGYHPRVIRQAFRVFLTMLPSLPHALGPPVEPPYHAVNAPVNNFPNHPTNFPNAIFAIWEVAYLASGAPESPPCTVPRLVPRGNTPGRLSLAQDPPPRPQTRMHALARQRPRARPTVRVGTRPRCTCAHPHALSSAGPRLLRPRILEGIRPASRRRVLAAGVDLLEPWRTLPLDESAACGRVRAQRGEMRPVPGRFT